MIKVGLILALTLPYAVGLCDVGWKYHENYCYAFSDDHLSWFQAASTCLLYGAYLVEIDTQQRNEWLVIQLTSRHYDLIWTSGTCRFHNSQWLWLGSFHPLHFLNWDVGQPKNPHDEQCLQLLGSKGYTWYSRPCHDEASYVCQKKAIIQVG